jgi:hypothetical protein
MKKEDKRVVPPKKQKIGKRSDFEKVSIYTKEKKYIYIYIYIYINKIGKQRNFIKSVKAPLSIQEVYKNDTKTENEKEREKT